MREKLMLQGMMGLACCVPIAAGLMGVLHGPAMADMFGNGFAQGHFKYLSGLLLGIGIAFAVLIPSIERQGARVQLLASIVLMGGLARLLDILMNGMADTAAGNAATLFALLMELVVTPALCWWQWRFGRRYAV